MTPEQFIALWKDNKHFERGRAQAHFDDSCDLLGVALKQLYKVVAAACWGRIWNGAKPAMSNKLMFRKHALQRMFLRSISTSDVVAVLTEGKCIIVYPDGTPYPSRLMLG